MLLWILRGCYLALILGVGLIVLGIYPPDAPIAYKLLGFSVVLLLGVLALVADISIRDKQITTISAIFFGLLIGLVVGTIAASALEPFLSDWFGDVQAG